MEAMSSFLDLICEGKCESCHVRFRGRSFVHYVLRAIDERYTKIHFEGASSILPKRCGNQVCILPEIKEDLVITGAVATSYTCYRYHEVGGMAKVGHFTLAIEVFAVYICQ